MATISQVTTAEAPHVKKTLWEALGSDDDGAWEDIAGATDITIQAVGSFTGTPTVTIEGSNDGGTTQANLSDLGGTEISITSEALVGVLERPEKIRPKVTSGDGSTDIDVHMIVSRR